jgi:hypothetical protein
MVDQIDGSPGGLQILDGEVKNKRQQFVKVECRIEDLRRIDKGFKAPYLTLF